MAPHDEGYEDRRRVFLEKIHRAAAKAISEGDCWKDCNIPAIPAERVIRHMYNVKDNRWHSDESIVKIEKKPFTNGAMRYCFRMKKIATPPQNATNHRFHSYGWSRALNYVAKAYTTEDGIVDTSDEAKDNVRNDIILQYEAARLAEKFNKSDPPKAIDFIRAYAVCFPDRDGSPLFAVERFIAGDDYYGAGFTKHNTNSGFVDLDMHRVTPQVFSAHSFYASNGTRLVADIQGIGDLWTDPQVLSQNYRFGEGDLGPRGMALFFKTFRQNSFSDSMGIPIFALSRNELKHQAKYCEDESTLSNELSLGTEGEDAFGGDIPQFSLNCRFAKLDMNRQLRKSVLMTPLDNASADTEKRSNMSELRQSLSASIKASLLVSPLKKSFARPHFHRTRSDVDEVTVCLKLALRDKEFDNKVFHRLESGEVIKRSGELAHASDHRKRRQTMMKHTCRMMVPNGETKMNLGRVHYHLACLHGSGRFPEIIPAESAGSSIESTPTHDVFSVLFHLCHASSLRNVPACLALARVRAGLDTTISDLLKSTLPVDFDSSKDLLRRAMEDPPEDYPRSSSAPRAAAGCLLVQILEDEGNASDKTMASVIEETVELLAAAEWEAEEEAARRSARGSPKEGFGDLEGAGAAVQFDVGDKIEANFAMEGEYYSGVVVSVENSFITVTYDDDGSEETLSAEHVRLLGGQNKPSKTTGSGSEEENEGGGRSSFGPMSDEEALGVSNDDERFLFERYLLKAKLAEFKAKMGKPADAAALYEEAADEAMNDGKMQTASEWSCKASELAS